MKTLLAALIAAATIVWVPTPGLAATAQHVPSAYFGMHDTAIGGGDYPGVRVGSVRLWDTRTTWRDVEVSRGVYDWSRLDVAVDTARAHGASVMLVMSGTPIWYAKDPTQPSMYGNGFCSPTNDLGAWRNYVRAVATRYKGRISAYEPHNEGDILSFWCGSMADLINESRIAYQTIKSVDPRAVVTSPSFVDRTASAQTTIMRYLTSGGARWADAISYHPYGLPSDGPEQSAALITALRHKMHAQGITKPVWTTEINYGLPYGAVKPPAALFSTNLQAAYVTRTYLLQRAVGTKRVYWYDWGNHADFLGVHMFAATDAPDRAFATVRWWMHGRFVGCSLSSAVWTCTIRYGDGIGLIKWVAGDSRRIALPRGTAAAYDMFGNRVARHAHMYVGAAPILFRTVSR